MINANFEGFRYHKPLPNFYSIENPKNPKTIITDDLIVSLTNLALKYNFAGLSYSKLMHGLTLANITINRKMLSEIAIHDEKGFTAICDAAKAALAK